MTHPGRTLPPVSAPHQGVSATTPMVRDVGPSVA